MHTQHLHIDPRLERGDDFYEALVDLHRNLTEDQSCLVNAKLILLLSNHIGDLDVLTEAMRIARHGVSEESNERDA